MIGARLPDAVLRVLPPGTPTAPLLAALRAGRIEDLPPEFVAWARHHGFDAGEDVELLPEFAAPPLDPAAIERARLARRRADLRRGGALLALSPLLAIAVGLVLVIPAFWTLGIRETGVAPWIVVVPLLFWASGQVSPPFALWLIVGTVLGLVGEIGRCFFPVTFEIMVAVGAASDAATVAG